MTERNEDSLDKALRNIFGMSEAKGYVCNSFDGPNMSEEQARETAQMLTIMEVLGKPCFVCGKPFVEEDLEKNITLGPIGQDQAAAVAHQACYQKTLSEHPEIRKGLGKRWNKYSKREKELWVKAFSGANEETLYGSLFSHPKRSK